MKIVVILCILAFCLSLHTKSHLRQCPCDQTGCPACMLGNALRQSHEAAEQQNLDDSDQEKSFAENAELQNKLFETAEKYAQEASDYEAKSQEAAKTLQEMAQKAQISRNKYLKIQAQAKQVAMKTIQTVQVHAPVNSNFKIVPVGMKTQQIIQNVPQYQININNAEGVDGAPDSVEEAELRQQLTGSVTG